MGRTSRRAECARKIPCVCAAPVDSTASMRVPKIATLRRIRWDERPENVGNVRLVSCAQDTIACAPHRSIRFDAGNPYYQDSELRRSSDW